MSDNGNGMGAVQALCEAVAMPLLAAAETWKSTDGSLGALDAVTSILAPFVEASGGRLVGMVARPTLAARVAVGGDDWFIGARFVAEGEAVLFARRVVPLADPK